MIQPATKNSTVTLVISLMGVLAIGGMFGTIYLCRISNDPTLVAAAVKMIQTDPSSALAAMNLLRPDASIIAIVAGMTGVCIGGLNGMLNNTRTSTGDNVVTKETLSSSTSSSSEPPPPATPPLPTPVTPPTFPEPPVAQ